MVPTNTVGSWFQSIRRETGSNKYSGKSRTTRNWFLPIQRKLVSTNTAEHIIQEIVPTNMAVHWFQSIRRKIGSNKYSGKSRTTGNWYQPIRRVISSNQYSGKYFAKKIPPNTAGGGRSDPTNTAGNNYPSKSSHGCGTTDPNKLVPIIDK